MAECTDGEDDLAPPGDATVGDATVEDLVAAAAQLAGLLLDEEDIATTLQRVADLALLTVEACTAASVTLIERGKPVTAVATGPTAREIDEDQYDAGDGPCLEAISNLATVRVDIELAAARWPRFTHLARRQGVRSFLAEPLVVRQEAIGALNLFSDAAGAFDRLDARLLGAFTAQASIALANARAHRGAVALVAHLTEALASRAVIEQAKGMLMAQRRVDADTAFDLLRRWSQQRNTKLRAVAQQILDANG